MQTSRPKLRVALAGLAVLGLAGGMSACGGSSGGSAAPGTSATGTTGSSGSPAPGGGATYAPGTKLTTAQVSDMMRTAAAAMTTAHIQMSMDMSSTGAINATGDVRQKPLAEDLTMKIMGKAMEIRLVGQAMYMHMPGLPAGTSWMKMDLSAFSKLGMGSISTGLTNPMGMLDEATKAVSQATFVDHETLDGEGVDHYRLSLDSKKVLAAALPSGSPSGVPGTSMPKQVVEDVYLDSAGHMTEAKIDMGSTGTMTAHMSEFGEKVDVQTPPAGQTQDMTDMLSQLGSSLGS